MTRRRVSARRVLAGALLAWLLVGCAQTGKPPVAERSPVFGTPPDSYRVEAGDTLYSIAWRFGLDHQRLARANGIAPPFTIYPGQRLRLREAAPARSPVREPRSPAPSRPTADGPWQAPTGAPVARSFGDGNKGIDYRLGADHRVRAAAAGDVVYAGSGLGGYRHLVIVRHGPEYLSAYSFDLAMAVAEGQLIKAGAVLADKVVGGRRPGTLHFEIRRHGDPVDPRLLIGPDS